MVLRAERVAAAVIVLIALVGACDLGSAAVPDPARDGGTISSATPPGPTGADAASDAPTLAALSAADVPIDGIGADAVSLFNRGDALFGVVFREPDGLGPYYIRSSCGACHEEGARGPGLVQKMVIVESDGVTPAADQSLLPFGHTIRQGLTSGATMPLVPPVDPRVKLTVRIGPPVLGRGYLEAVADSEIERVESEQATRSDGIHGKINRVVYGSVANPDTTFGVHQKGDANLIGRFGVKARIVSVDDFVADAFQGDMGITSPLRPTELDNPGGLIDDAHAGVDVDAEKVNLVADYLRRIAIPVRDVTDQGRSLFDGAKCSVCHVPSMKTRPDYPIKVLAGIDAPIFTDLLVHEMGDALADGMTDGSAGSRSWRTSPLIGLRFDRTFLHDGRATSIDGAIRAHDGEAKEAANAYAALSEADRGALLSYVGAL